jgi:hypothetical protein
VEQSLVAPLHKYVSQKTRFATMVQSYYAYSQAPARVIYLHHLLRIT